MAMSETFQAQRGGEYTFDLRLAHGGGGKIANPRKDLSISLSPQGGFHEPSGLLWTKLDDQGQFIFPAILPGFYTITVRDGGGLADIQPSVVFVNYLFRICPFDMACEHARFWPEFQPRRPSIDSAPD